MPKGATIVVLCEDLQSRVFVVRALARMGHDRRSVRVEMAPPGEGAAERYVREPSLAADLPKPLDEVEAFPKLVDRESRCAVAAEAFADHARLRTAPAAAATVPSLLDGLDELRRLP